LLCLNKIYKFYVIYLILEQEMSKKKLFGIMFLILSYCEFGNFVYSKASSPNVQINSYKSMSPICCEDKNLDKKIVFNGKSTSYFLPR
jgi:hypothetical protein